MKSNRSAFSNAPVRSLVVLAFAATVAASQAQTSTSVFATNVGQNQIVTFKGLDTFANFVGGVEINGLVGAKTFYDAGYTGTRSTVANIEGGIASTTHQMTSKIGKVFYGTGALSTAAAVQTHATECSSMIAGYYAARPYDGQSGSTHTSYSTGIGYGANLWTGNIATAINANGSFSTTTNSVFTGYYNALIGGVGGQTANIASSSWGATSGDEASQRQLSSGLSYDAISIDAVVSASHKLICVAAGNNAKTINTAILNTPGSPAGGNNALVVGASGTHDASQKVVSTYNERAYFSAYGPSAAFVATSGQGGNLISETVAQRARVDILAPGQSIVGASSTASNAYGGGDGTSFATPIVAGGAALIEDAGQALGYANSTDDRVVTAILQTSADKLAGWTNNSTTTNGVQRTTQALDFQQGAGEMNLTKAYDVLTGGTHDVAGNGGGAVLATGWDYGALSLGATNTYTTALLGGSTFTSTLRFNSGATYGTLGADNTVADSALQYQYLSDFSLQLYRVTGLTSTLVAESNAAYITSEHFQFTIPTSGVYQFRVNYVSDVYNLVGNHGAVGYGLAWSGSPTAVPEPASLVAVGLGLAAFVRRRKRA